MDSDHFDFEYVIIGGGLSGLSAANTLVDEGKKTLLIDPIKPGSHKICGEFFSPEAFYLLEKWGCLPSCSIDKIEIHIDRNTFSFYPKKVAKSEGHDTFDRRLFERALNKGLNFYQIKVEKLTYQNKMHILTLENGQIIQTRNLFMGIGRQVAQKQKYIGFKTHFSNIQTTTALELYLIRGGYIGLCQVGNNCVNVAGLINAKDFSTIEDLIEQTPKLKLRLQEAKFAMDGWKMVSIGSFGFKKTPKITNYYLIGDGYCSLFPASGLGLTLAILSGHEAAKKAMQGDWRGYCQIHYIQTKKALRYARLLHFFLSNPFICKWTFKHFPKLCQLVYELRSSFSY